MTAFRCAWNCLAHCLRPGIAPPGAGGPPRLVTVYTGVPGALILDNDRVQAQRIVLEPGQSSGRPIHPGQMLQVFVRGGVLRSHASGRAVHWRDGRVLWHGAPAPTDAGCRNDGPAPIEMVWVWIKPPPATGRVATAPGPLDYPRVPGEDLLENDAVFVQRFVVAPGQWEGVHAHDAPMLYIHVKGGVWAVRSHAEAEHTYEEPSPDGEVGWMPAIDLAAGHESGNVGTEPIDLIWVTLKR